MTGDVGLGRLNYYRCGNNAAVVIYLSILFTTLFCLRLISNELGYAFKWTYVSHVKGCLIPLQMLRGNHWLWVMITASTEPGLWLFLPALNTLPLLSIRWPDLSVKHSCQDDENCHTMTSTFEGLQGGWGECLLRSWGGGCSDLSGCFVFVITDKAKAKGNTYIWVSV